MFSHLTTLPRHSVTAVSTAKFPQSASGVLTMADAPQRVQVAVLLTASISRFAC